MNSVDDGDKKNRLSNKENSQHIHDSRGTFVNMCFSDKGVMNLCQFFYTHIFAPFGGKKIFFIFNKKHLIYLRTHAILLYNQNGGCL